MPPAHIVMAVSNRPRWTRNALLVVCAIFICALAVAGWLIFDEATTSRRQAAWLSAQAPALGYTVQPGATAQPRFPTTGPFDERLGYRRVPEFVQRLSAQGYELTAQARMSPRMVEFIDRGLHAPYRETVQAGLDVRDCRGDALALARYPQRVFDGFGAVPTLLVDALLFIEDRHLLDAQHPMKNPAVEWDRFGKAAVGQGLRRLTGAHTPGGGSTLATQIEKYRHSAEGRTVSAEQKLRQMASASLRAYLDGTETLPRRQQIVVDYLNTVPLSAKAGFGEVNGVGDGLWAWYGRDFDEVRQALDAPRGAPAPSTAQALAFKQALSLMVAQRRPSHYLAEGEPELRKLTDAYLRLLADAGVITPSLRDVALTQPLRLQRGLPGSDAQSFVDRKAGTLVRARLQTLLGVSRAYDLDRLHLAVRSPLDGRVQRTATELLRGLADPKAAQAAGLYGFRLLDPGHDPSKLRISFTLYERGETGNLLRVQTDNFDQPFDLNDGARLDLGSTSKLRTLTTYLEMVAELHHRWSGLSKDGLAALTIPAQDTIGRWAREQLLRDEERSLRHLLDQAMDRVYSASPAEGFYTGGGLHHFDNFDKLDDSRDMTLREALTRSVNLPFIRLMRDLVHHVTARGDGAHTVLIDDPKDPRRREFLARFADKEGREFLGRFHRQYAGKSPAEIETLLQRNARGTPSGLAAALYGMEPTADTARLRAFIAGRLTNSAPSDAALQTLAARHGPDRWSLADRAYLAGVHPLELWVAAHLRAHPQAGWSEVVAASTDARQASYEWLFKTRHKSAQDSRIRNLVELDAFTEIHAAWRRLGYPFDALTPSYASALGASGDRPAALAELMGIIVNGGLRLPVTRVESLRFARGTPYETQLARRPAEAERVMPAEVADVLRAALIGVVEDGTAKRLEGALVRPDGTPVTIGGKTGTGDQRFDVHGRGGVLISSRVVNRTATLVFLIGERHFGTLMAYVPEPHAAAYSFTSALPSQLLKALLPALQPLIDGTGCPAGVEPATFAAAVLSVPR